MFCFAVSTTEAILQGLVIVFSPWETVLGAVDMTFFIVMIELYLLPGIYLSNVDVCYTGQNNKIMAPHGISPTRWETCPHKKKIKLKLLLLFLDEILSLENKYCVIEKCLSLPYILLIHISTTIM